MMHIRNVKIRKKAVLIKMDEDKSKFRRCFDTTIIAIAFLFAFSAIITQVLNTAP